MPRALSSLLAAARTAKREDRLTALLAVVLEGHLEFANRLLAEAELPNAARVEVSTEVRTRAGRRVDMELLGLDERGSAVARLWSEHKTGAEYQPEQLPDYHKALSEFREQTQLITIVPDRRDAEPAGTGPWEVLTWWRVAVLAWEAGKQERGHGWRRHALDDNALGRERLLLELLSYLEEEHDVMVEPLSHVHVLAFARADETADIIIALLERAGELSKYDTDGGWGWSARDSVGEYWQLFSATTTWAERLDGYPELHAGATDEWSYDRLDEPAFGAGFTLPEKAFHELRLASRSDWRATLEPRGVSIGLAGDLTRVYRTMYLAELVAKGATLDAQATALRDWLDESIDLINAADPGLIPATTQQKTASG